MVIRWKVHLQGGSINHPTWVVLDNNNSINHIKYKNIYTSTLLARLLVEGCWTLTGLTRLVTCWKVLVDRSMLQHQFGTSLGRSRRSIMPSPSEATGGLGPFLELGRGRQMRKAKNVVSDMLFNPLLGMIEAS